MSYRLQDLENHMVVDSDDVYCAVEHERDEELDEEWGEEEDDE